MPGTTNSIALRYPLPAEAPDGPGGISNLAADVDDRLLRRDITSTGNFIGQRSLVNNIEYRWDGNKWAIYNWPAVNRTNWAAFLNDGYADSRGMTELSVISGVAVLAFSTTRDAGILPDQTMLRLNVGFRPSATIFFGGRAVDSGGTRTVAGFRVETDGTIYLDVSTGSNLRSLGGSIQYRITN